ncbi:hypothetical protein M0813_28724 [Anaeramoeba flamelloides]|uniref:E2F/DP family winged-helix DNA-binding domain-containing protein n=1 Tax=Anaeramoeba flamelloides TaxID=1746091 RepID=A0ABQ8XRN8_9EUKA|nr:hypothetical protein M0813_28724 [Anaeramoeba flamelloides]
MSFLFYPLLWQYGEYLYSNIKFDTVFKLIRIRKKFAKRNLNIQQKTEEKKKLINERLAKVELLLIQNRVIVCPEKKRRRRRNNKQTLINLNFDQSKEKYLLSPIWSSVFITDLNQKTMATPKGDQVEQTIVVKENQNKQKEHDQNSKKGTKRSTKLKKTPRCTRTIGLLGFKILQNLREGPKSRESLSKLTGFSKQRVCTVLGIYKLLRLVTENEEKALFYWNATQGNLIPKAAPYCRDIYKARKIRQQLALKVQELTGKLISRSRQEKIETTETIEKSKIFSKTINCLATTTPVELQNTYYNKQKQEPEPQEKQKNKVQNTYHNKQDQKQDQTNKKGEFSKQEIQVMIEKLKKHKESLLEKRNNLTKTLFLKTKDQNTSREHQIAPLKNEEKKKQKTLVKEKPKHPNKITKSKSEPFLTWAPEKQSPFEQPSEKTVCTQIKELPIVDSSAIFSRSKTNPNFRELELLTVSNSSSQELNSEASLKEPILNHSNSTGYKNHNNQDNNDSMRKTDLTINSFENNRSNFYTNMETKHDLEQSKQTTFSLSETFFTSPTNFPLNLLSQLDNSISPPNNENTIPIDYDDLDHLHKPTLPQFKVLSNYQTQNYLEIPQFFPNNFEPSLHFGENSRFNFEDNWNPKNNYDLTSLECDTSFI